MKGRQSKAPSQRQLRVGEELRHALAGVLLRGDIRDPVLQEVSVTVTEVRVSPDLRNATAFVVPLGGGRMDEVLAALRRATPYLRGQLAREVRLRVAPVLGFAADTSFDQADRIERLLRGIAAPGRAPGQDGADRPGGDRPRDDGAEDDGS